MRKKSFPISEIKISLERIEVEVNRLKNLTQGIPGAEKNIAPIMTFIDILKFHLGDLKKEE
jgi:hypothetical protein